MSDLYNEFPSWGETGEYPSDGFFYEGGDQVNEKHMDSLWNGIKVHIDNLNQGIRDRVRDIEGDIILDNGLVVSQGTNALEVDVTASSEGGYVDGQFTGSTTAQTVTLSSNGGSSTRTDSIWVDVDGQVGKAEGTTSVSDTRHKIAEVDVATDDTISGIRNTGRDIARHFSAEVYDVGQVPGGTRSGDLFHDKTDDRLDVRQGGSWQRIITEQDDITISGGDGLKGGNTIDLVGGGTLSLDIEPADFAGDHLSDDGNDNLQVNDDFVLNSGDTMTGDLTIDNALFADQSTGNLDIAGELTEGATI